MSDDIPNQGPYRTAAQGLASMLLPGAAIFSVPYESIMRGVAELVEKDPSPTNVAFAIQVLRDGADLLERTTKLKDTMVSKMLDKTKMRRRRR